MQRGPQGRLRKREERREAHRAAEGSGYSTQQCLHKQRLWVLTEWSEAPSRACIAAALTAGIAAAPLTHAGSGDTAAPC